MPSLSSVIRAVERSALTLRVLDPPNDGLIDAIEQRFRDRNVRVVGEAVSETIDPRAVLQRDGTPIQTVSNADLLVLAGRAAPDPDRRHPVDRLAGQLSETTFTSRDVAGMTVDSREIEDRAFRVGEGELHAGFQRLGSLSEQSDVYRRLATTDLDVYAYAVPDHETTGDDALPIEGVRVHIEDSPELARHWFVAFDGGPDERDSCGLLAEEREPRRYRGILTYDPETVALMLDRLRSRYDPNRVKR